MYLINEENVDSNYNSITANFHNVETQMAKRKNISIGLDFSEYVF